MSVSLETKEKGLKLFKEGKVKKELETDKRIHFRVIGETETHFVIYDKQKREFNCDCKYNSLKGKICSHIIACQLYLKSKE